MRSSLLSHPLSPLRTIPLISPVIAIAIATPYSLLVLLLSTLSFAVLCCAVQVGRDSRVRCEGGARRSGTGQRARSAHLHCRHHLSPIRQVYKIPVRTRISHYSYFYVYTVYFTFESCSASLGPERCHSTQMCQITVIYLCALCVVRVCSEELDRARKAEMRPYAVFPCRLRVIPQFVFRDRDPIVIGVKVEAGLLINGTPLSVVRETAASADQPTAGGSKEVFLL